PGSPPPRRRAVEGALRVPLGRPVPPLARPRDGARLPRRDAAAGRREGGALLLDVRAEVLLDGDHPAGARVRRHPWRRGRAGSRGGARREGPRVRRAGQRALPLALADRRAGNTRRCPSLLLANGAGGILPRSIYRLAISDPRPK